MSSNYPNLPWINPGWLDLSRCWFVTIGLSFAKSINLKGVGLSLKKFQGEIGHKDLWKEISKKMNGLGPLNCKILTFLTKWFAESRPAIEPASELRRVIGLY